MASVAYSIVDWKGTVGLSALSSKDTLDFGKVKEAIFKCYDIKETYRQSFWSAKLKEGESLSEVVNHLSDMAAKWLKEHDTRERVIDMIVKEQFLTMLLEDKLETGILLRS